MKRELFLIIFLMCISLISSLCEEGQIDINTASKEELEKLYLVGPVKAEGIINTRPFDSVDDIIKVYGIGEKTVGGIKGQGLACVDKEVGYVEEEEIQEEIIEENVGFVEEETKEEDGGEIEIISLTGQTIKSPENNENKSRYAMYGFAGFCVLLGILFMLKKKKYKNEFR